MADGGGARPESERGRGFQWSEAVARARGAVGRGVALERGDGEEWVTEERTTSRARHRGKKRGEGSDRGSATRRGAASWGLAPTGGRCPTATRARRARVVGRKQRGGLTGGPRHSAGLWCH
jgi:hypothetical protein